MEKHHKKKEKGKPKTEFDIISREIEQLPHYMTLQHLSIYKRIYERILDFINSSSSEQLTLPEMNKHHRKIFVELCNELQLKYSVKSMHLILYKNKHTKVSSEDALDRVLSRMGVDRVKLERDELVKGVKDVGDPIGEDNIGYQLYKQMGGSSSGSADTITKNEGRKGIGYT